MAAWWGLIVIAFAALSQFIGVTLSALRFERGLISREQDPDWFRKAVGVHIVIGLLFIIGWFIDHYWPSVLSVNRAVEVDSVPANECLGGISLIDGNYSKEKGPNGDSIRPGTGKG